MSKTIVYKADQSWNYVGKFYGIDPVVLAAFNGKIVDPSTKIPSGFKLKIPSAFDLAKYYPEYKKIFTPIPGLTATLRPPTLTDASASDLGTKEQPLVQDTGNQTVVNAARMRRFSHTGDNYSYGSPLRTPNPRLEGGTNVPDANKLSFASEWWKCNVLVGDTLYSAGFDWPMSEYHRYYQPSSMLKTLTAKNSYADVVWVADRFKGGGKPHADIAYVAPTSSDLKDVKPGDVMLLHDGHGNPDLAGHSAIVTSTPRVDADGRVLLRVVDIYGEEWYDVANESVKAILRPKKKLYAVPSETVGGDANHPEKVLDGVESLNGDAVPTPAFAAGT